MKLHIIYFKDSDSFSLIEILKDEKLIPIVMDNLPNYMKNSTFTEELDLDSIDLNLYNNNIFDYIDDKYLK